MFYDIIYVLLIIGIVLIAVIPPVWFILFFYLDKKIDDQLRARFNGTARGGTDDTAQ